MKEAAKETQATLVGERWWLNGVECSVGVCKKMRQGFEVGLCGIEGCWHLSQISTTIYLQHLVEVAPYVLYHEVVFLVPTPMLIALSSILASISMFHQSILPFVAWYLEYLWKEKIT
ncbi:hypothetical protein SLEP1_g3587 [Rubroshorea leprosula]|uniref:Uncharacterized protein n=1 Tax=Rubroshorea leprosula TaxID=152421 RepID=A0AAV5HKZ2_9ROSI|nr:hypothetical protein SLEP1_g3587 [Rubroshorea leprosula]